MALVVKFEKYGLQWKAMQVTGKPRDNRDAVDWTRGSQFFALMEVNAEGVAQLGFNGREGFGFLEPGEWIAFGEDEKFHRFPASAFEGE